MQNILVIDDEAALCGVVCTALKSKGYGVTSADNITQGLQLARTLLPDLIISDVLMKNGDGYQLQTALWHDESTAGIPFIIMTGDSSRSGPKLGMQLGAEAYLSKPFGLQTLFDTVDATLRKKEWVAQLSRKNQPKRVAGNDQVGMDI